MYISNHTKRRNGMLFLFLKNLIKQLLKRSILKRQWWMPVISAIRRRTNHHEMFRSGWAIRWVQASLSYIARFCLFLKKKKEFRKTVNYENVLYLIQNLNIQSMPRQETSAHLQDGREIGNGAVFAGKYHYSPCPKVQPTESAMTCQAPQHWVGKYRANACCRETLGYRCFSPGLYSE